MFDQIFAAMNKPTAQNNAASVQRMMESGLRLTQAQMGVYTDLFDQVGREFRNTLSSSSGQSAMDGNWPQLISKTTQANVEAGVHLMQNVQEFQNELLQSASPLFSGQFLENMVTIAQSATTTKGGATLNAVRAKKAA